MYWIILLTFPLWAIPVALMLIMLFVFVIIFTHWICGGKIYINEGNERVGYVRGFKFYEKEANEKTGY